MDELKFERVDALALQEEKANIFQWIANTGLKTETEPATADEFSG
jgi:hypothetical protein